MRFYNFYMLLRLFEMVQRQRHYAQRNKASQQQQIKPLTDKQIEQRYVKARGLRVRRKHQIILRPMHGAPALGLAIVLLLVLLALLTIIVNTPH